MLRVRADESLGRLLRPPRPGDGGRLEIPSREALAVGERVCVEISFGPRADEVVLVGEVGEIRDPERSHDLPIAVVRLGLDQAARAQYVREILEGHREPSARGHRRVGADFPVRWRSEEGRFASRLKDLSRGGAFILSRTLPAIGERVDLELEVSPSAEPLSFESTVSWVLRDGNETGFGVCFRFRDRDQAARLHEIVRRREWPDVDRAPGQPS